jgi:tRNA C32,U32 (ribose-2'-O)-methylase TrmJ
LLVDAGFLKPDHPKQLKLRLRRIFNRARLDRNEVNILRGMLTALSQDSPPKTDKKRPKKK